jgi:auxin influx carrier (AUX1 LAX family)
METPRFFSFPFFSFPTHSRKTTQSQHTPQHPQIGQIMLVMPRAIWLMGMGVGLAVSCVSLVTGGWTLYVLLALYLEYKRTRGGEGGGERRYGGTAPPPPPLASEDPALPLARAPASGRGVVQYHDVVAGLGWPAAAVCVQALTAIALLGVAVAQILACATNTYAALDAGGPGGGKGLLTKRVYALAWGGAMLAFTAVPSYRDTRVINAVALLGTTFTAWYIVAASRSAAGSLTPRPAPTPPTPTSARNFFLGATIMVGSLSGHVICMEVFDALGGSSRFLLAYLLAQAWVLTLTIIPAGVAAAAFGGALAKADSVYGVLPPSAARSTSAWLMNVHQVVVFGLVLMPLYYYAERAAGLHPGGGPEEPAGHGGSVPAAGGGAGGPAAQPGGRRRRLASLTGWRRFAARMAARLPLSLLVWLLALAFPFYGAINALTTSLAFPALSFLVPCVLFNRVYGRRGPAGAAARDAAPLPPTLGGLVPAAIAWPVAIAANWVLVAVGTAFMAASVFFSVGAVVRGVRADGVFAPCWQCAPAKA